MGPPPLPTQLPVAIPSSWTPSPYSYAPPPTAVLSSTPAYAYSAAHAQYPVQRKMWQSKAYQSTSAPLVTCRFRLEYAIVGKLKGQLVGVSYNLHVPFRSESAMLILRYYSQNIVDSAPGIPADAPISVIRDAGRKKLTSKIEIHLRGVWLDWSDIALKDAKNTMDLDSYAEAEHGPYLLRYCTKSKSKEAPLVFTRQAVDLVFMISESQWDRIEDFRDKQENESAPGNTAVEIPPTSSRRQNVSEANEMTMSRRPAVPQITPDSESSKRPRSDSRIEPTTPPKAKRMLEYHSPDQKKLLRGLEVGGSSASQISGQVKLNLEQITFFPIPTIPLHDLLDAAGCTGFVCDPAEAIPGQLNLAVGPGQFIGRGAFKTAQSGYLTLTPLQNEGLGGRPSEPVVAKRPYANGAPSGNQFQISRLDPEDEFASILMEANVLKWSLSLWGLVEAYIQNHIHDYGLPVFDLPSPRFVQAGVALVHAATPAAGSAQTTNLLRSFLLEELIKDHADSFRKFIGNRSAVPLPSAISGPDDQNFADFLAFTQHLQYWKTRGLVYLSDLQGTTEFLTDPQIMTAPGLAKGADLFADGNVASAFADFPKQHQCNRFCRWFDVPEFGAEAEGSESEEAEAEGRLSAADPEVA
uniref:Alpha-type protein kinase domain-containing protein n=1 Tax=Mycena chlorophos TaxID=658473 RepID=A0ABQ0M567_MYCCL|nr:predicted protein [Mycena chlorophos]